MSIYEMISFATDGYPANTHKRRRKRSGGRAGCRKVWEKWTLTPLITTYYTYSTDGNPHLLRILRLVWPAIWIQRCLVHVQRQGLSWCRRDPKRPDAKHLRALFLHVMAIHTATDRERFLSQVQGWEHRYGRHIARAPETGWVFSDLKRARSMLLSALPDMFRYLDDARIATSTNAM